MDFSIKTKLVLSSGAIATVLFATIYFAGISWYASEQQQRIDDFLETEAGGVAATVLTYYSQQKETDDSAPHYINDSEFLNFLESFLKRRADKPLPYKTTLSILDLLDRVIATSNQALDLNLERLGELNAEIYNQKSINLGEFLVSVKYQGLNYRVMYLPLTIDKTRVGALRIACLLDPTEKPTYDFAVTSLLFILFAIASNVIGGMFLTARVLRPVESMRRAVEKITQDNLHHRITDLPGKDELSKLSKTFNETLDRIENAYRSQEELVNDLSHQLRTPLTTIRGMLDVSIRQNRPAKEYKSVIEDSIVEIDRLTMLLNTMLSLAKIEGHMVGVRLRSFNVADLIGETVDELKPLWEEKSIVFQYTVKTDTMDSARGLVLYHLESIPMDIKAQFTAEIDPFRLKQAFINIFDNAYRFSPFQSEIKITLSVVPGEPTKSMRIAIQNSGPPIPDHALPHIFEKFYRMSDEWEIPIHRDSDSEVAETKHGFGLGLNICKRILDLHHGSIRAYNLSTGGVVFEMTLPREQGASYMERFRADEAGD